jgi:hypothetical protein
MGCISLEGFLDFLSEYFGGSDVQLLTFFTIYSGQLLRWIVIVLGFLFWAHFDKIIIFWNLILIINRTKRQD